MLMYIQQMQNKFTKFKLPFFMLESNSEISDVH